MAHSGELLPPAGCAADRSATPLAGIAPSRSLTDRCSGLEAIVPFDRANPDPRSVSRWFSFNERPWTHGPSARGPGLWTVDLFHRISYKK
jgi:hypothetical protein